MFLAVNGDIQTAFEIASIQVCSYGLPADWGQNGLWGLWSVVLYPQLECGPMPNLMVALPNLGGALCSTPQSLADAHY